MKPTTKQEDKAARDWVARKIREQNPPQPQSDKTLAKATGVAVGRLLKAERKEIDANLDAATDQLRAELVAQREELDAQIAALDGNLVLGATAALAKQHLNAITRHCEDILTRKSVVVEGKPPAFAEGLW
ncbi:hypothetical protein [Ruegeria lacuscaerulensis]|uniref:hypothetical protein n=1 Tax=Ruegeria lacuscaerulensis TaxID=55218 RepID=UPI00147CBB6C|nr:hypothetical protein [Ruegeria lacuscaerulensis]